MPNPDSMSRERPLAAESLSNEDCRRVSPKSSELISKHLDNAKQQEWTAIAYRTKPLELLDLPVDVLQSILREVTHTNDLTALALTHTSLHNIVIPHIYSRFDIVWPEASAHVETRVGVDALTYGLATLVMAPDVFGEAQYQVQHLQNERMSAASMSERPRRIRRGNYFAEHTRKFSLGNGPADWVQEYLITKEGGKMLGTLVALAVGRMRNLETFIWDMPTGVLRDVWLALASLGTREDGQPCKLDKVWVRWHDNSDQSPPLPPATTGVVHHPPAVNIPSMLATAANTLFQIPPYPRVEFPTFSILPPLKSLNVLDVDELPYVEEISVLVERSLDRLRELRIGLAEHAEFSAWAWPSEDRGMIPNTLIMPMDTSVLRPGGVLGIIVSRFCEPFRSPNVPDKPITSTARQHRPGYDVAADETEITELAVSFPSFKDTQGSEQSQLQMDQLSHLMASQDINALTSDGPGSNSLPKRGLSADWRGSFDPPRTPLHKDQSSKRLSLDVLELERIFVSTKVFSKAIDWSRLTTLTLLGCRNHEQLWRELRRQFTPASRVRTPSSTSRSASANLTGLFSSSSRNTTPSFHHFPADEYALKLRRLHTDAVSPALIAFIKDTLAPDTLEWLFLQEHSSYKSSVSIDTIYKGAIRRHRGSLRKLLIDSEVRREGERFQGSWKRWLANRDLLTSITGKMALRELSIAIDYKDWHFFLQRLPSATRLRSLHIAHISEHVHGTVDAREAALQVLDIVSLRPELELCYLGIQRQCFEVLEHLGGQRATSPSNEASSVHPSGIDSDDNDEAPDDQQAQADSDLEFSSAEEDTEDEGQAAEAAKASFRLREILFYDDKVSIFRARHGKL